jgi:hemoglobin
MTLSGRIWHAVPRSRAALLGAVLIGSVLQPVHHVAHGQTSSTRSTLYQRLGGYDGVASYIALVFPRVAQHPDLAHMFRGHGTDSQERQFQLVVELICHRTGGPCAYVGRPMPLVHAGLGITEANWSTFMKIISDGMTEKKYPPDVRDEFLAIWRSFHDDVVQK